MIHFRPLFTLLSILLFLGQACQEQSNSPQSDDQSASPKPPVTAVSEKSDAPSILAAFSANKDHQTAVGYYEKSRQYIPEDGPGKVSRLEKDEEHSGGLLYVVTFPVSADQAEDYVEWSDEYRTIAENNGFEDYWVYSSEKAFHFAILVGDELKDYEDFMAQWDRWHSSHQRVQKMHDNAAYEVEQVKTSLWRHHPTLSYQPENFDYHATTYSRSFRLYVKIGHMEEMKRLIGDWKQKLSENQIDAPYEVYTNIYGTEPNCIILRSSYRDVASWEEHRSRITEQPELEKMLTTWDKHLRDYEVVQSFIHPELSHSARDGEQSM